VNTLVNASGVDRFVADLVQHERLRLVRTAMVAIAWVHVAPPEPGDGRLTCADGSHDQSSRATHLCRTIGVHVHHRAPCPLSGTLARRPWSYR
jgi:hypothetical protein